MTSEQIEKLVTKDHLDKSSFQISFKTRPVITGVFIKLHDYDELRRKNLWRIVAGNSIAVYKKTPDPNLARIFNGSEFTRLSAGS